MGERITLDRLNTVDADTFAALLAGIVEHAPQIAQIVAASRPFGSVDALHAAFFAAVTALPPTALIDLLRGHPELAGREAEAGEMTAESVAEQGRAGLDRLSRADVLRLRALNAAYRERFGFPFLICVRRHSFRSILEEAERRLVRAKHEEIAEALGEIRHISRLRLEDLIVQG